MEESGNFTGKLGVLKRGHLSENDFYLPYIIARAAFWLLSGGLMVPQTEFSNPLR